MLKRLIESRQRMIGNEFGTAASTAIHLVLISVAAFMTTANATPEAKRDHNERLHWLRPAPQTHTSSLTPKRSVARHSGPLPAAQQINLAITTNVPNVNIELASIRTSDFGEGIKGPISTEAESNGLSSDNKEAYDILEVETPAAPLPGANMPAYPPSMRSAGIEGRVVAQFVVDNRGRATRESIRILSSSNELFSESVRKAIEQARFTPARVGGKPVSQIVQQLFVFKLDR
jgi:protein TonB